MKWQPMPALEKLPSGSFVEVACGQPAQNAGMRRSRPSGRSTASGAGGAGRFRPARPRNVPRLAATLSGDSSINGEISGGAERIGLAADFGAFVGRQVIEGVADLAFDETALFLDDQDGALAAGEIPKPLGFQRPGHADFVDGELRVVVQTEAAKGVQGVLVRLTDGDQADGGVRAAADKSVYAIGAGPGEQRGHALLDHPAFEFGSIGRKMHSCDRN